MVDDLRQQAAEILGPDADPGRIHLVSTLLARVQEADTCFLENHKGAIEQLRQERDQAVAHDRQPYPTAWAYEQACKAREAWRERAEKAEAAAARVREACETEAVVVARGNGQTDDSGWWYAVDARIIQAALDDTHKEET